MTLYDFMLNLKENILKSKFICMLNKILEMVGLGLREIRLNKL
jgi:hypothetical protein